MLSLYKEWYVDRDREQLDLFEQIATKYHVCSVLYPGSYVQISPSFFFPYVCYVDSDSKARSFFKGIPELEKQILCYPSCRQKDVAIQFYGQDYAKPIDEPIESFDLLISQYAGFICEPCKRYLKKGKYLLANNSHGDAGIAALDNDYRLISVINQKNGRYCFSQKDLDQYFVAKKPEQNTRDYIHSIGKGIAYTKTAPLYLFERQTSIDIRI